MEACIIDRMIRKPNDCWRASEGGRPSPLYYFGALHDMQAAVGGEAKRSCGQTRCEARKVGDVRPDATGVAV